MLNALTHRLIYVSSLCIECIVFIIFAVEVCIIIMMDIIINQRKNMIITDDDDYRMQLLTFVLIPRLRRVDFEKLFRFRTPSPC